MRRPHALYCLRPTIAHDPPDIFLRQNPRTYWAQHQIATILTSPFIRIFSWAEKKWP